MKLIKPNILSPTDGSFSRASIATYIDSDRHLKVAPINTPRFHYFNDGFKGILLEEASTNYIEQSEIIPEGPGTDVVSNSYLAPDNTTSADALIETVGYNGDHISYPTYVYFNSPTKYVYSVFIKKLNGSTRRIGISAHGQYSMHSAIFDFSLGIVSVDMSGTIKGAGYEELSDSWYRVWVYGEVTSTPNPLNFDIRLFKVDNFYYVGEAGQGVIAWGQQLEYGLSSAYPSITAFTKPTSYIKTTGAPATRAADVITGSGFIYSDVINADANYSAGTTYAIGNRVTYSGKTFESLQNSNINHDPLVSPTWWLLIGPDNRHAAFDNSVSTVTQGNEILTLVVKPGSIDSVGLIDMEGIVMEFAVTDITDGLLFTKTVGLSGVEVNNWHDYFFLSPLSDMKRTQYIFNDLPSQYTDPIVTIRIKNGVNVAKLGLASFGKMSSIGEVEYGAGAGIVDYSVKSTDEFGNTSLVQRNFSKKLSARCFVPNKDINRVQRTLYSIRATPVVWVGVDDPTYEEAMIVWGFYKDFTTEISYPTYSLVSIEIEGLS